MSRPQPANQQHQVCFAVETRRDGCIQAILPFACNFLNGVTVLPFLRKHCTLATTLEMGKIYSNHLLFLSYLLKCPVDNAGNGISEPQNLKFFWRGAYPQTVIPPTMERLRTSNFFSLCVAPSKTHATSLKSIRISKTCYSRQFQEATLTGC